MPETLFLTVNLIDRFLAEKQVTRKNLQLVRALSGVHLLPLRSFGLGHAVPIAAHLLVARLAHLPTRDALC